MYQEFCYQYKKYYNFWKWEKWSFFKLQKNKKPRLKVKLNKKKENFGYYDYITRQNYYYKKYWYQYQNKKVISIEYQYKKIIANKIRIVRNKKKFIQNQEL